MRALALLLACLAAPALACGPDSDCVVGDRTYRISLPEGEVTGALVFAHGYRGKAAGEMRNKGLVQVAHDRSLALIALQSADEDWDLPHAPRRGDASSDAEMAYVDAVIADAEDRFGIEPSRLIASGFSAGGMMTWELICRRSAAFVGFVPYSGTFWSPIPETCEGPPANIVHVHGTEDPVVPMDGRPIADTRQGAVPEALAMYAGFGGYEPAGTERRGDLDCKLSLNPDEALLALCVFPGKHSFRPALLSEALDLLDRR